MSFIEDLMNFDSQNFAIYSSEKGSSNPVTNLVYKTQPKNAKSEDGCYRCTLRVIGNPYNWENSIVKSISYSMNDANGWFSVISKLTEGDRECPIFKAWKELWFSGDEAKKQFAKDNYDKREEMWVTVQILEDPNFPELNGQIKIMKLPTAIWKKMDAKMHPSAESRKPQQAILDWLIGNVLSMEVQPGPDDPSNPGRKQREVSYDLCDFDSETAPIMRIDGTPLFDDDELAIIEDWSTSKTEILKKIATGKETAKSKAAEAKVEEIREAVLKLYDKALNYLKETGIVNVADLKGYKPWDEATTNRVNAWIDAKRLQANGGKVIATTSAPAASGNTTGTAVQAKPATATPIANNDENEEELPF